MGEMIKFDCPDGSTADGYLAEAPGSRSGVVVIQEWWGLNDQIKGTADRFAEAGFTALAPDLYHGRVTQKPDEANHMMEGLDWVGATEVEIHGACRRLKESCDKVGVTGFCLGGALTVIACVKIPNAPPASHSTASRPRSRPTRPTSRCRSRAISRTPTGGARRSS